MVVVVVGLVNGLRVVVAVAADVVAAEGLLVDVVVELFFVAIGTASGSFDGTSFLLLSAGLLLLVVLSVVDVAAVELWMLVPSVEVAVTS